MSRWHGQVVSAKSTHCSRDPAQRMEQPQADDSEHLEAENPRHTCRAMSLILT